MLYNYSEEEIRSKSRLSIESMEKWARTLIDSKLSEVYGEDYFHAQENGNNLIKNEIVEKAENMKKNNNGRFPKLIDTLFLDEIITILCKESLYKKFFKPCLDYIYPDGNSEARTFLKRIIPIRNKLSHSNPISIREAEQAICYSNDFVDGVKEYMKDIGKQKIYNVPNIIRINDSLGHEFYPNKDKRVEVIDIMNKNEDDLQEFNIEDRYTIYLTLDPSFDEKEYNIEWQISGRDIVEFKNKKQINLTIKEDYVGEEAYLVCTIVSNKKWHRYSIHDQKIIFSFRVLPPN